MSKSASLPQLTTLAELPNRINEIVTWTVANPVEDHVYHFKVPESYPSQQVANLQLLKPLASIDAVIAGSSALHRFIVITNTACHSKWKPTDADIFFLNQTDNNRLPLGNVDIVQAKEKTVQELLLNFDLPVCRVAMNFAYDFWISAQCIASIHTHKQNCPLYLKDRISFYNVLRVAKKNYPVQDEFDNNIRLYNRFTERVKKYQDRGFGINWIETNKIIPWVLNRFHYNEWLLTELPAPVVENKSVTVATKEPACPCPHCRNCAK